MLKGRGLNCEPLKYDISIYCLKYHSTSSLQLPVLYVILTEFTYVTTANKLGTYEAYFKYGC